MFEFFSKIKQYREEVLRSIADKQDASNINAEHKNSYKKKLTAQQLAEKDTESE